MYFFMIFMIIKKYFGRSSWTTLAIDRDLLKRPSSSSGLTMVEYYDDDVVFLGYLGLKLIKVSV